MSTFKAEHTPEPWSADNHGAIGHIDADGRGHFIAFGFKPPDARRTVVCVNACRGIPTETLEAGVVVIPTEVAQTAAQAIDELLRLAEQNPFLSPQPGALERLMSARKALSAFHQEESDIRGDKDADA